MFIQIYRLLSGCGINKLEDNLYKYYFKHSTIVHLNIKKVIEHDPLRARIYHSFNIIKLNK